MTEPRPEGLNSEICKIVDAARGIWMRRLIDYSRANSLLFYRDLKVGTLDLSAYPEAVIRLLGGEKLGVESVISTARHAKSSDSGEDQQAEAELRQKIRSTLVALQRKALSNLEEKGIETLYLSIGLATWPATDDGRPYDAPVLLLPARIEVRGRATDELRLIVSGEPCGPGHRERRRFAWPLLQ
jgi:hypothetical protein